MKKQFLAIAALLLTIQAANAQTEKGKQTIGANLGFSTQKNSNTVTSPPSGVQPTYYTKQTTLDLGPTYSYFVADGLDIGATLYYNRSDYEDNSTGNLTKQKMQNYGGHVFLRKYFMYDGKLGLRTGARAGYLRNNSNYNYNTISPTTSQANTDQYYGGLLVDAVYYPSKKIGVAAMIANATYSHNKVRNGTPSTGTGDAFNVNFVNSNLALSVFYTF